MGFVTGGGVVLITGQRMLRCKARLATNANAPLAMARAEQGEVDPPDDQDELRVIGRRGSRTGRGLRLRQGGGVCASGGAGTR